MYKLLLAEPKNYPQGAKALLSKGFAIDEDLISYQGLLEKVDQYFGLLVRLDLKIDAPVLNRAKNLKFIATPTTGEDHIDVDLARSKGIKVISLKGERDFLNNIYPTAEHTFGLLFSVIRKIPFAFNNVRLGEWQKEPFMGSELHGKTFGIIGLGRLGSMVACYARAFGMTVLANDIIQSQSDGVEMVSLEELFKRSDIVSLHVNYSDQKIKMINADHFRLMKDNAVFINTSRGQLVDETALLESLANKPGFFAGLDVIFDENEEALRKQSKLLKYAQNGSNLVITPHIGGYTRESIAKTRLFIARKILSSFSGKEKS